MTAPTELVLGVRRPGVKSSNLVGLAPGEVPVPTAREDLAHWPQGVTDVAEEFRSQEQPSSWGSNSP